MRAPMSAVFLLAFTVATSAGQSANSPFSIDISGPKTVKAGAPIEIKAVLTNTSDHSLDFKAHEPGEFNYSTEVFKSDGQREDYTTHGYLMATGKCDPKYGGTTNRAISCAGQYSQPQLVTLRSGGKYLTLIVVTEQFHLRQPGDYLIRVSRSTAGEPRNQVLVMSNTMTVTVTP